MKQWIDLTMTLQEGFKGYPGDEPIRFYQTKQVDIDGYNLKRIETSMHVGTHMDAPRHVCNQGKSIEEIDINNLIGIAEVIRPVVLHNIIQTDSIRKTYQKKGKILILDLQWEEKSYEEYYQQPKFQSSVISFLKENKIQVIGFNIPSPEYETGELLDMHKDLLAEDIIIIENLIHLGKLDSLVEFIALPLRLMGLDGSLTRCVARNL
ncbi:MAG: cyclase family protein [Bacilli bacterium]|nr:cyclase family protein [Bacilli bacterium]MBN2876037.1 cyclase family protein [Bacilli bacterium]